MYICTRNYDLKRGGTFETAKAGTFHSVTAGTLIPLFTFDVTFGNHFDIMLMMFVINYVENFFLCILFGGMKIMFIFASGIIICDPYDARRKMEFTV
jgi:hypothetical protein